MLAVRTVLERVADARDFAAPRAEPRPDPAEWLNVQQAACELNVSVTTLRRMVRKGKLRSRIVPRRGGYTYLIHLPNSMHARGLRHPDPAPVRPVLRVVPAAEASVGADAERVRALEQQVEHLSEALARALKLKQKALPPGMGEAGLNATDPYGRYRWLVRRRRWWPF